jgi:hypothetical protein
MGASESKEKFYDIMTMRRDAVKMRQNDIQLQTIWKPSKSRSKKTVDPP